MRFLSLSLLSSVASLHPVETFEKRTESGVESSGRLVRSFGALQGRVVKGGASAS